MRSVGALLPLAAALVTTGAAAAAPAREAYQLRRVLTLPLVVHVAAPRSDPRKLYLVQQEGRIRVAVDGKLRRKPFLDLSNAVSTQNEQGLLSLAFHPRYAKNRLFYVNYTDRQWATRVVEYRANADGTAALAKTARRIFYLAQPGPEHNGGQLAFGPDGKLYTAMGDGQCCDDPKERSQNMSVHYGKVLQLDLSGRPPRIVGLGLRNPWRFSFDRANGDLYLADVGSDLREEVNYLPRAELGELFTYGWDAWEGSEVKEAKPTSSSGRLLFPIHAYPHGPECSITGGFVYRGAAVPEARGRYFFGDYCSGAVWSLSLEAGKAADVRREPFTVPQVSTFGEDARGELYAVSIRGGVYRLVG